MWKWCSAIYLKFQNVTYFSKFITYVHLSKLQLCALNMHRNRLSSAFRMDISFEKFLINLVINGQRLHPIVRFFFQSALVFLWWAKANIIPIIFICVRKTVRYQYQTPHRQISWHLFHNFLGIELFKIVYFLKEK